MSKTYHFSGKAIAPANCELIACAEEGCPRTANGSGQERF